MQNKQIIQEGIDMAQAGSIHKQDGVMSFEQCPFCAKRLMINAIGNKWCSNLACGYHIRDGQQARIPQVTVLPDTGY